MVGCHDTAGRALGQTVDLLPCTLWPPCTSSLAKGNRSHLRKTGLIRKRKRKSTDEKDDEDYLVCDLDFARLLPYVHANRVATQMALETLWAVTPEITISLLQDPAGLFYLLLFIKTFIGRLGPFN